MFLFGNNQRDITRNVPEIEWNLQICIVGSSQICKKCALFVDYKFRKLYDEINLIT